MSKRIIAVSALVTESELRAIDALLADFKFAPSRSSWLRQLALEAVEEHKQQVKSRKQKEQK
jgi:hypothetical protein